MQLAYFGVLNTSTRAPKFQPDAREKQRSPYGALDAVRALVSNARQTGGALGFTASRL